MITTANYGEKKHPVGLPLDIASHVHKQSVFSLGSDAPLLTNTAFDNMNDHGLSVSYSRMSFHSSNRDFSQRALHVKKGLCLFNILLITRSDSLRGHISEFQSIADVLDKVGKKKKTMGIAGGTTGAVGGVAAVVGIALAPITMGASLIATAVGAGMVASAGGMGAKAAMASKKSNVVDRQRVDKVVQAYQVDIVDVERCLFFIRSGMDELRRHDVSRLQRGGADPEALRMANVAQSVHRSSGYKVMGKTTYTCTGTSSERHLQAFARELDFFFTEKNCQRLKKNIETKFANRVRSVAQELQQGLDELNQIWKIFSMATSQL